MLPRPRVCVDHRLTRLTLALTCLFIHACRRNIPPSPPPEPSPKLTHENPQPPVETTVLEEWAKPYDPELGKWLHVIKANDNAPGGWATGDCENNRITITTHDVTLLHLDLSTIPINWDRRVVLRVDGSASELTRKHLPTLRLKRTPTGGWQPDSSQQ